MTIFVTGANGFLGSNIVRALLEKNYKVKTFILPNDSTKTLDGLDIEISRGNILDADSIEKEMAGCDAVVHAAALTDVWPDRSEIVCKVNIEGTHNMMNAALKLGIKRFVYIGSGSSFAHGTLENPGHEDTGFSGAQFGLDYIDSKYQAQLDVLEAVKDKNLPALIIAPTFMMGPYDSKPNAGKMIIAVNGGKLPFYTAGGRNFVHVKDVAMAAANGVEQGRVGECYLAGNANLSFKEVFQIIGKVTGKKPPSMMLPTPIFKLVGRAGSLMGAITKKPPLITYPMTKVGSLRQCYKIEKAVKELNMPQTPVQEAIQEAYDWLNENGYL